ncbi:hypothetical protein [Pseudooceanicola marinus]|uniref:hypothetical protein n=1 Tax=Pseudooceanicola marinus TaxID=396013 RepID=UPI001CD44748|nr:hypothetical protein [Pseudooceanicola marinus]MCA1338189.1 hypothetical protein [Pseudooceanicola marinus]
MALTAPALAQEENVTPTTPATPPIDPNAVFQIAGYGQLTGTAVIALAATLGVTVASLLASDGDGVTPSTPST